MVSRFFTVCLLFSSYFVAAQVQFDNQELTFAEIDSICGEFYNKRTLDKAIPYFKAALETAEEKFGQKNSTYAKYAHDLGFFYYKLGKIDDALKLQVQALEIRKETIGKKHKDYLVNLNNLGNTYTKKGAFSKAEQCFVERIEITEGLDSIPWTSLGITYNNFGTLYKRMGYYDKAIQQYEKSLEIYSAQKDANKSNIITSTNNLATVYARLGRSKEALSYYLECKEQTKRIFGDKHPYYATILNNIGSYHFKKENFKQALNLYLKSSKIREEALGKEHYKYLESIRNIAMSYLQLKKYSKAKEYFENCKKLIEKILGKKNPQYYELLITYSELYYSLSDYENSISMLREAKEVQEDILSRDHPNYLGTLQLLAKSYWRIDKKDIAWEYIYEILSRTLDHELPHEFDQSWSNQIESMPLKTTKNTFVLLRTLETAFLFLKLDPTLQKNSSAKQIQLSKLALSLLNKIRPKLNTEDDQLAFLKFNKKFLAFLLEAGVEQIAAQDAFSIADYNKTIMITESTQIRSLQATKILPDSLIWKDKRINDRIHELETKILGTNGNDAKIRAELNLHYQKQKQLKKQIEQDYPNYYQLLKDREAPKIKEIQTLLDKNTAILEYVVTDSIVHIFKIKQDKVEWFQKQITHQKLDSILDSYYQIISSYQLKVDKKRMLQAYKDQAYLLSQMLIHPILSSKDKVENLIIIPDAKLAQIPFESFILSKKGDNYRELDYLLNHYNISYNYSISLRLDQEKRSTENANNHRIFAFAAHYEQLSAKNNSKSIETMRDFLVPLPAARSEVEALEAKYKGTFVFDSLANEAYFVENAKDYGVIHLAMHGIVNKKYPMLSALAFSNPLNSNEDNFLYAHEILKLDLQADLVVLSACETGYGQFEFGNGVASLARSFMYRGVHSLVVSLWQVNDISTKHIMQNFYRYLAQGKSKSQALRFAKMDYIKSVEQAEIAKASFWSAFIIIGDDSPIKIKARTNSFYLILGVIVIGLIGLFAIVALRLKRKGIAEKVK